MNILIFIFIVIANMIIIITTEALGNKVSITYGANPCQTYINNTPT